MDWPTDLNSYSIEVTKQPMAIECLLSRGGPMLVHLSHLLNVFTLEDQLCELDSLLA